MKHLKKLSKPCAIGVLALIGSFVSVAMAEESSFACNRTVNAQVIALDQPWMWNRLGAAQPGGMIYALYGDVVQLDGSELPDPWKLSPDQRREWALKLVGNVRLRDEKRARPLVLRANKGDCLAITFWNLLSPEPKTGTAFNPKLRATVQRANDKLAPLDLTTVSSATRWAGIHANGIELVGSIGSDASWVGENPNGLAKPGEVLGYKWYAAEEGTFLIYSPSDMESGEQAQAGLFGAINVEPEGAEWYRSQVTHDDLEQATLAEGDLKEHYRTLEKPEVVADPLGQAPVAPAGFIKEALINREPDKRSSVDVYVKDSTGQGGGHIYTSDLQPLVYYQAIYGPSWKRTYQRGRPVLQMLQVVPLGDALYDEPLKPSPSNYVQELQDLDAGIIPEALREIFAQN